MPTLNASLPPGFVENEPLAHDAVERMYAGQLRGVVFRQLCSPSECARIVDRLHGSGIPWTPAYRDLEGPQSLGVQMAPTEIHPLGPPLAEYFATAEADARIFRELAEPALPRCEAAWSAVANGRPVHTLAQPRPHRPATLRQMRPGHGADLHVDTYRSSGSFAHLHEHTNRTKQLSWYLVVQSPESGGVLEVGGIDQKGRLNEPLSAVALGSGDAILFDGSGLCHRITKVVGARARNTLGGFAALSADGSQLLYWA